MILHKQFDYLANHIQYLAKIARWRTNEWSRYNPTLTYAYSLKSFKEHCNYNKLPITYLYFENSKPIAMFSIRTIELLQYKHLEPWIGGIYVQKNYRNRGIGKRLIHYAEKVVASLNYKVLYLFIFDLKLQSWYENLGYKVFETNIFNNYPIIVMKKDIKF
jgi:GNAT superfamily N-acetyltransferase